MDNRILIVDDNECNCEILRELLEGDYQLEFAFSGEECLEKINQFTPDLVLLDIMMPGMDGYEVCRRIKSSPMGPFTQVVFVSGKALVSERIEGYEAGADGYLVKPFDHEELMAQVRMHFRLREARTQLWRANEQIREFNSQLEAVIRERTAELLATRDVTIFALATLTESRDPETGEHLDRMRRYSRLLAEQLQRSGPYAGKIDDNFVDQIYQSSPLHDIGKVGIPDAILLKPGPLTPQEFEVMKRHSMIGYEALRRAAMQSPSGSFLEMAAEIARHHHEWYNGAGYPDGLVGNDIPLSARIVALADVFDALTSTRVYKPAYEPARARTMILEQSGTHFEPAIVEAFEEGYDSFLDIWASCSDPALTVAAEV